MPIGNIFRFWNLWHLVKEIDPSDITEAADRLPKIEIDAGPDLVADLTSALGGGASRSSLVFQPAADGVVGSADLVIQDAGDRVIRRVAPRIVIRIDPAGQVGVERSDPDRTVVTVASTSPAVLQAALVPVILEKLPDHAIALGRHFPTFRQTAAQAIVRSTSRGNAEFAALSNLPALIPVVGGVVGDAADFLVLTKNQVLMLLKLATIYDRDSRHSFGILREILPVVGAGLVWRTVARELAGLLPFAVGTIPKVLIAYVGTYAAGMSALYYYQEGRKPPRDVLQSFQEQALDRAKELLARLPGQRRGGSNGSKGNDALPPGTPP